MDRVQKGKAKPLTGAARDDAGATGTRAELHRGLHGRAGTGGTAPPAEAARQALTLRPYQRKALKFFLSRPHGGLFLRPGRGKTAIVLEGTRQLGKAAKRGQPYATLVVCPLRVAHLVWPKELRKWKEFAGLSHVVLHGPRKDALLDQRGHHVYIINYDGLPWLADRLAKDFEEFPFAQLIVDESSKIKDGRTKRYRLLDILADLFQRRWILTGSPRPNSLLDVFAPVKLVDRGATFGAWFIRFREAYFTPTGYGGHNWVPKPDGEKRIYKALAPLVMVLSESDSDVGLPPLEFAPIEVELDAKSRAVYHQMEQELVLQFRAGKVTAANAAVMSSKCRQIASGALYLNNHKVQEIHSAKIEALVDLVDELQGKPLLVIVEFQHEVERIRHALKQSDIPYMGAGMTTARSKQVEADWNAGRLQILLAHTQSVSHGLNLQEVEAGVCFFSLPWSWELYDQAIQRVWRSGQRGAVIVYDMVTADTVDGVVLSTLRNKQKGEHALFEALKEYWAGQDPG